jgi:hypothetical protein
MHPLKLALTALAALLSVCPLSAQQSFYENLRAHNTRMTEVQPTWMGPLTQSDARLTQAVRLSVANWTQPGAHPISYGNNHGATMVFARRLQLELDPPPFYRNHAAAMPDGFANLSAQVKVRLASGNAQHGNYALSAIVAHGFGPRALQNGALSSYYEPSLVAGKALGRFATISQLGGWLPTAKTDVQGRAVTWSVTEQVHVGQHAWFDVENNYTRILGSPADGQTQNMLTPAAYYMIRRKAWKPEHAALVVNGGFQNATSHFHNFNHNVIAEVRILY